MKGIDIPIQTALDVFNDKLWTTNKTEYYGRCFVNDKKNKDGEVPEIFIHSSRKYKDALPNSRLHAMCFFDVATKRDKYKADVDIYFALNLEKLYPVVAERATEYAIEDISLLLNETPFSYSSYVTDKDAYAKWGNFYVDSMHPFWLLKFECTVELNC